MAATARLGEVVVLHVVEALVVGLLDLDARIRDRLARGSTALGLA